MSESLCLENIKNAVHLAIQVDESPEEIYQAFFEAMVSVMDCYGNDETEDPFSEFESVESGFLIPAQEHIKSIHLVQKRCSDLFREDCI